MPATKKKPAKKRVAKKAIKRATRVVVPEQFRPKIDVYRSAVRVVTEDPMTGRGAVAQRDSRGIIFVTIGCQEHKLAAWRRMGASIISENVLSCEVNDCRICAGERERYGVATNTEMRAKKIAYTRANLTTFLNRAERELRQPRRASIVRGD